MEWGIPYSLLLISTTSTTANATSETRDSPLHGVINPCTIGGYESAWLADLVAAFVLENTTELFEKTPYDGIYRDDGLVILDGLKSNNEIGEWLGAFQEKVNEVTGYEERSLQSVFGEKKRTTRWATQKQRFWIPNKKQQLVEQQSITILHLCFSESKSTQFISIQATLSLFLGYKLLCVTCSAFIVNKLPVPKFLFSILQAGALAWHL
jgi:hypothetical protein